jgi:hypothetical protein
LESSIQADKGSSALPDELAVLILRSDCIKLVETLATDGSKETKTFTVAGSNYRYLQQIVFVNAPIKSNPGHEAQSAETFLWVKGHPYPS